MRIAIIDLGTNSVRFDIHQFGLYPQMKRLHREKIMVRLGQDLFVSGKLNKDAIRRTLHAFLKFKHTAQRLGVNRILAFGTSALRDACDADQFTQLILRRTGIRLQVISGAEEAKLIALGILNNEKINERDFALVDIGGGSTEISICIGKKVVQSHSFQLGTARLQQVFLKKVPPRKNDILQLREFVRNMIHLRMSSEKWPTVKLIIGSSGTIKVLGKIIKKIFDREMIERSTLQELIHSFAQMNRVQLLKIPGVEIKRADMILAGAILLEEIMSVMEAKVVGISEYSLRDGILEEEKELLKKGKKYHLSLHLEEFYRQAGRFGQNEHHLSAVVALAEKVFHGLKAIHQLDLEWMMYLVAATILRDIGESISISSHGEQSYYIINNCDLPPMESWEIDLIAKLCLYHEGSKYKLKSIKFNNKKVKRSLFLKLLAMLRIVNSIDTNPEKVIQLKSVRITKQGIQLKASKNQVSGLENQYLEIDKKFFDKVFRRGVKVISP